MIDYMREQVVFFPERDHWDHVWWAIVNEIVDSRYR